MVNLNKIQKNHIIQKVIFKRNDVVAQFRFTKVYFMWFIFVKKSLCGHL